MRICIIGPATNVHVHRWASALIERGHAVSVLSTAASGGAMPDHLRSLPVYGLGASRPGMDRRQRLAGLLGGWARVPALLAALKPDIVHVHSLPVPAATPFLMRVPRLVVSAWGSDVVWRDRRKSQLYPWLLAHAARVTATSQYLAGVVATYLRHPRPIDVVAFGVDEGRFHPAPVAPSHLRLGTLRHLEPRYGVDLLLASLSDVVASYPTLDVQIAGAGPQQPELEQMIGRLGLTRHVTLRGRIPHDAAPDFLRSLSLFVNPSREESFGVAAVEAQACGLPVVATRVGALDEIVRDGVTGVLVPPADPAAMSAALIDLLGDAQRRHRMGAAARKWVLERYRWHENVEQMITIYEQVRCGVS